MEKILTRASEKLASIGAAREHRKQVEVFKKFLKIETERLRIRHRLGLSGKEVTGARSHLVDLIISRAFQSSSAALGTALQGQLNQCAIAALGGYGRRELAPFSDVDILFLHAGKQPPAFKGLAEQILYLLWDIGLTVGHSFRSIRECLTMAKEDLHSRNAMAESRFLAGSEEVFRRFEAEIDQSVFKNSRERESFLKCMRLEIEERTARFGSAVCVQEPNIKESPGGLRDLHTVLWIGRGIFNCQSLDELRERDLISDSEREDARAAYDFLARIRNEAHFSTGRKTDFLTLELQPILAFNLGYKRKRTFFASELFMREYYRRAHQLHQLCHGFLERVLEMGASATRFKRRPRFIETACGFQARQGKLYCGAAFDDLPRSPVRLLEAFCVAQSEGLDLSESLKQTIRAHLFLVNRNFRDTPEASRIFLEILRRPGRVSATLRPMHELGFLGRLLPEFARITFLVQHDHYHQHTIDEHTLRALEVLDCIAQGHDPKLARFAKVFSELSNRTTPYLALLLHDCGKGHGRDHTSKGVRLAERVCRQLRLDEVTASQTLFLVRHHLLMSRLSQRRDLSEESLIEDFVATVGTLEQLDMLLLLTYADASSVGPDGWNHWKVELLWELYSHARCRLTGSKPARWDPHRTNLLKQQIVRQLLPEFLPTDVEGRFAIRKTQWWAHIFAEFLPAEVERHFAMLPERYLRATEPDQIVRHLRLIKRLETQPLAIDWQTMESGHCSRLTICTRDSAGLFARVAGTLTAHAINILSADLYTREDGVVIDTFRVSEVSGHHPIPEDRWPAIEESLKGAVRGTYDVAAAVEKWLARSTRRFRRHNTKQPIVPSVHFDSEASATSTVIEVRAEDEPGLAYKIARALSSAGLNITFAKIATEKSHALDVFYATHASGRKLIPTELSAVEYALQEALGGGPTVLKTTVEMHHAVAL
ncbi:MAG TPA: [protein-PII] uridylyltransferase [Acidobacteriota bacterium]|nr:[protein-PII] uridylyltransferase [Acidobacteriota bacterium]